MFNVTGGEFFMILVVALIVLGPERLPGAARRIGEVVGQLRDLSEGFRREVAQAMDDPGEPIVKPMSRPRLTALEGGAEAAVPATPADLASEQPPSPATDEPTPPDGADGAGGAVVPPEVGDGPVVPVLDDGPGEAAMGAPRVDDAAGVVPPDPDAGGRSVGPGWTAT